MNYGERTPFYESSIKDKTAPEISSVIAQPSGAAFPLVLVKANLNGTITNTDIAVSVGALSDEVDQIVLEDTGINVAAGGTATFSSYTADSFPIKAGTLLIFVGPSRDRATCVGAAQFDGSIRKIDVIGISGPAGSVDFETGELDGIDITGGTPGDNVYISYEAYDDTDVAWSAQQVLGVRTLPDTTKVVDVGMFDTYRSSRLKIALEQAITGGGNATLAYAFAAKE